MDVLTSVENLRTINDALAAGELRDCDQLLYRGAGFLPRAIQWAGRGKHSHAAKLLFIDRLPFVAEVREWKGGRLVTLKSQVERYPGRIDVYRIVPGPRGYDYLGAREIMLGFAGCDYGWRNVIGSGLSHLPYVRHLIPRPSDEDAWSSDNPPFCSQACSIADRLGGGVDPVRDLADGWTEPSDLARSLLNEYVCTLTTKEAMG